MVFVESAVRLVSMVMVKFWRVAHCASTALCAHVLIAVHNGLIHYCHVFKMEAHKKGEGGDFAALFSSDGSVNMAEFCEKISKRLAHFLFPFRKLQAH